MKKLLISVVAGLGMWSGSALACMPPDIGDVFRYDDGTVMQLRKNVVGDCYWGKRKQYMCPVSSVGSTQGCRWMWVREGFEDGREGIKDGGWIIRNGGDQVTVPECDPSTGFVVGCKQ
jgi:hypothetical protein